jgi:PAS domain S-box-containing protein
VVRGRKKKEDTAEEPEMVQKKIMQKEAKILVVDDDLLIAKSIALNLKSEGYEAETAGTGKEALEKMKTGLFHLILLDISLPDTSGLDLIKSLKEINRDSEIIMVTGYATLENSIKALNEGAAAYITKPVKVEQMLRIMKEILEKQRLVMENKRLLQKVHEELEERKKAEEELRNREKYFRSIMHRMHEDIIVIDRDFRITDVNNTYLTTSGKKRKDILGRSCYEVIHENKVPCEEKGDDCKLREVLRTGRPANCLHEHTKEDGSKVWVDILMSPMINEKGETTHVIQAIRDVTDTIKTQRMLTEEKEKAQKYLDIAGVTIVVIDREDKVLLINKKGCDMLGYREEEIVGKNWFESFIPGRIKEEIRNVSGQLLAAGKSEYYENPVLTRTGEERLIAWHNIVLKDEKGHVSGHLSSGEDITERKRSEEQLMTLFELSKKLTALIPDDTLLTWIAEQASKLFEADSSAYRIKEGDYLVRGSCVGEGRELMFTEKLRIGESLSGLIAKEKKPLLIEENYPADPRLIPEHREIAVRLGYQCFLGVPMMSGGEVIGVLVLCSKKPGKFTVQDIVLLSSFADLAAVAIRNSLLFSEREEKVRHFKALYELNKMIASELKKEDLLPLIAKEANKLLGTDGCNIRLREDDELVASYRMKDTNGLIVKERIRVNESLSGIIVETGTPLAIEELGGDERYLEEHRKAAKELGFTSFLGVPMTIGNEIIGVLNVHTRKKRSFLKKDIELLSAFANQAAIAVKNADYLREIHEMQRLAVRTEKLASIGKLAAGVTHEILNPVNIISMKIQMMLMKDVDDKELLNGLHVMKNQVDRIVKISEALLKFSRMRKSDEKKNIGINNLFRDTLLLVEKELLLKNIEIKREFEENLPPIMADANQLSQVFFNLITNARDAMPDGGTLTLGTRSDKDKKRVLISVKDTGTGIPEEILPNIFDPFFTTKKEGAGTGLGLSICYGIIEGHSGRMWAENNKTGGATFFIELPVKTKTEEK